MEEGDFVLKEYEKERFRRHVIILRGFWVVVLCLFAICLTWWRFSLEEQIQRQKEEKIKKICRMMLNNLDKVEINGDE